MSVTAQDWRVTAEQEVSRSAEHIRRARSEPDLELIDILRECWDAYQAAGAAVGAWAMGLISDGRSWDEIGAALDLAEPDVHGALQPLVEQARQRMHERLPHVDNNDAGSGVR